MKKLIIPLIAIFTLTSCTFQYNIKINKNTVDEIDKMINLDRKTWNSEEYIFGGYTFKDRVAEELEIATPVYRSTPVNPYDETYKEPGAAYYEKSLIQNTNEYGLEYKYKHAIKEFGDSSAFTHCYNEVDVENTDKILSIETSDEFVCFDQFEYLDEVEVNVSTSWDYKVVSNNADKVKNNKYTWIITRDNAQNKPIKIELQKVFNWRLMLIIAIPIVIVAVIVYFLLKNRLSNNSEI